MTKHSIVDYTFSATGVIIGAIEYLAEKSPSIIRLNASALLDIPSLVDYSIHCLIAGTISLGIKKAFDFLFSKKISSNGQSEEK